MITWHRTISLHSYRVHTQTKLTARNNAQVYAKNPNRAKLHARRFCSGTEGINVTITSLGAESQKRKRERLTSITNRRSKLNEMARELGVKTLEQWRKVSWKTIRDHGGGPLINWHRGSLGRTLADLYGDESLIRYGDRFKNRRPRGYWQDPKNQLEFLQTASVSLSVSHLDNWSRIAHWQLKALGGAGLLPYLPNAFHIFGSRVSSLVNKKHANQLSRKATQMYLYRAVQSLFPDLRVVEEHVIYARVTGNPLTVDVFVPELNLAFEYQGQQHFMRCGKHTPPVFTVIGRDAEKLQICVNNGITLIPVPFWWKHDLGSLAATVKFRAPHVRIPRRFEGCGKPLVLAPTKILNERMTDLMDAT